MHNSALSAKVAARNEVHARLIGAAQSFFDAVRPFVGGKILKVDGSFTKAFQDALASVCKVPGDYWLRPSYSLGRVFKTCVQGPRFAHYAEAILYIGEISNGVLVKLYGENETSFRANFRTDYTEAEVTEARAEKRAAEDAVSRAQSKLLFFGDHDNS